MPCVVVHLVLILNDGAEVANSKHLRTLDGCVLCFQHELLQRHIRWGLTLILNVYLKALFRGFIGVVCILLVADVTAKKEERPVEGQDHGVYKPERTHSIEIQFKLFEF